MIKELRSLGNKRLFEEVLADDFSVELINKSSDSLFVKYRSYKKLNTRGLTLNKSRELTHLIGDQFARLEVDFKLLDLTMSDVKRVVAIYFAKINNCKLTESQLSYINDLRAETARERKKKFVKSALKKLNLLGCFLKTKILYTLDLQKNF